ncbi:MAG: hypothetical protein OXO48_13800 [Caldilineaceae bacterium]|nr:hypothetical protein [Caldilineaceae bacterium]
MSDEATPPKSSHKDQSELLPFPATPEGRYQSLRRQVDRLMDLEKKRVTLLEDLLDDALEALNSESP